MTTIDYKNFINSNIIHHNDSIDNFTDGLEYMIKTKASIISYNTKKTLQLHNVDVLEVENNNKVLENDPNNYDEAFQKIILRSKLRQEEVKSTSYYYLFILTIKICYYYYYFDLEI